MSPGIWVLDRNLGLDSQCWMIVAGLGKIICHFPQEPVLDDFCRAGTNHLPTFPNGQCQMIFAGLGKINYPLSPMDSAG